MKIRDKQNHICALILVFGLFFGAIVHAQEKEKFVIVLDAGHGGHDPGNRGNGYKEKEIALNVVLQIGAIFEKDERFTVVYTRKTDKFIELHERGSIANKAGADLFVSIHCNSHKSQAYGTETFVLGLHANAENFNVAKKENSVILLEDNYQANYDGFDPNSPESIIGLTLMQEEYLDQSLILASFVQNGFTNSLKRKSRGVKQAGFVVLHQTYMPSVLIELGFLTNNNEGKYLNSKAGQTKMANSIVKSILEYKESLDAIYEVIPKPTTTTTDVIVDEVSDNSESSTTNITKSSEIGTIVFKVQIAAGNTDIELNPSNFNGLDQLSAKKIGDVYKYYFGNSSNYQEVQQLKTLANEKGFDSSFIVAFKDGQIIPLMEALKTTTTSN